MMTLGPHCPLIAGKPAFAQSPTLFLRTRLATAHWPGWYGQRLGTQVYLMKPNLRKSWPAHSLALWLKPLQHQIGLLAEVQSSSALGASPWAGWRGRVPLAEAPSSAEMEEAQKTHLALRSGLFNAAAQSWGDASGDSSQGSVHEEVPQQKQLPGALTKTAFKFF